MAAARPTGKKKANDGTLSKSTHTKKGSSQRPPGVSKLEVRRYQYEHDKLTASDGYTRPGSQNRNK